MFLLRTGIPSIDELFHHRSATAMPSGQLHAGVQLQDRRTTTSFCIVGPDGAGKSVLAMHIASRYIADCHQARPLSDTHPQAYYVSSDLTHSVAKTIWQNFALHAPNARYVPFRHPQFRDEQVPDWLRGDDIVGRFDRDLRIGLVACPPDDPDALARRINSERDSQLAFVDLASRTAGDDWAFVHRLLAALPFPEDKVPRHLVVVDAVEGMETFGGDLDAFGQRSPRRARIAKLMRLASGKCHIVLIIEEPVEGTRLPEQFVSDVVIRLRSVDDLGYMRRTIEIEKARGQPIVRGRHPYVIRAGGGSTTGRQPNWDDPRVPWEFSLPVNGSDSNCDGPAPTCQSYVDAFPSIHYVSRSIMEDQGKGRRNPPERCAGFGIHYLDQMLAWTPNPTDYEGDERGLPCSTVTALIGDAGTQKTGLGLAFLAQTFARFVAGIAGSVPRIPDTPESRKEYLKRFMDLAGVAVLITTHDENAQTLSDYFLQHLEEQPSVRELFEQVGWKDTVRDFIESRTICRRLEIHDSPPAVLLHTIRRTVEAAQQLLLLGFDEPNPFALDSLFAATEARFDESWPIRLVIDDFNTILDTYAQARVDPLFLPFLLFYLRREGVTSLIEDTRPGGPYAPTEGFHTDLRALSDHRIYTWHVTDFFGDHRVAIAPIPPVLSNRRMVVRELTRDSPRRSNVSTRTKGNLVVRTNFELYAGLEENRPRPVPLQVWLSGETDACGKYATYLDGVFKEIFTPEPTVGDGRVVRAEPGDYERLRDFGALQGDMRLNYTLVLQVDEFWTGKQTFRNEWEYLSEARVAESDATRPDANLDDPYGTYRQLELAYHRDKKRPYRRSDFFDVPGCDLTHAKVDRIPFSRDWGFLVCRRRPWQEALQEVHGGNERVADVWAWLQAKTPAQIMPWRSFLDAACHVAKIESGKRGERIPAFDLSMLGPESFSCLMLEVWLSEIYKTAQRTGQYCADSLVDLVGTRKWERSTVGLLHWLQDEKSPRPDDARKYGFSGYSLELYKAWLLLIEALDLAALQNEPGSLGFKSGRAANVLAVASRRWYKTAAILHGEDLDADPGPVLHSRLPGHFATRGDWFVAVVSGSRSDRLANRAVDLLCSQRGNERRLIGGIGLPARRLVADPQHDASHLATALRTEAGPGGTTLDFKKVLELGADHEWGAPEDFSWLWRSRLKDYQAQATTWQRWLYRVMRRWQELRLGQQLWKSGFQVYDWIDTAQSKLQSPATRLLSFKKFPTWCAELIAELRQVSDVGR